MQLQDEVALITGGTGGLGRGVAEAYQREGAEVAITCTAPCPGPIVTDVVLPEGPGAAEAIGMTLDQLVEMSTAESAIERTDTAEEVAAVAVLPATDAAGASPARWTARRRNR